MTNNLNQNIKDFLDAITSKSTNKIVSTRVNENYFTKIDKLGLWTAFQTVLNNLHCDKSDGLIFIKNHIYYDRPKCIVCGNPVIISDRKVSKFCSGKCARSHTFSNIAKNKTKQDYEKANVKRQQTMIEKYGVPYNSQREDIHDIWTKTKLDQTIYEKLIDEQWLYNEYVIKQQSATEIAQNLQCDYSTVLWYCNKHNFEIKHGFNTSSIEKQVCQFLDNLNIDYKKNYVGLYNDKREVDIWISNKNVAIEINGLKWHSEEYKHRSYHQKKTDEIKEGIRLIQITDYQWKYQQKICQSIIKSALGLNEVIYARKCEVEVLNKTNNNVTKFFDENHIDGFIGGKLYIMIKYDNQYVSGMIIGRSRFSKLADNELLRYVTKCGYTVVGGFNKLIKQYRKLSNQSLLSYLDKSLFSGIGYKSDNWIRLEDSDPGYFWTNGNDIIKRYDAMKCKLSNLFEDYDPNKSEKQNMEAHRYYRYFNSGNQRYLLNINNH